MLYTRKGDTGTTGTFGCSQRVSKNSSQAEALGALDEVNSFLGLAKIRSSEKNFTLLEKTFSEIVQMVQQSLFIIQAEVAGTPMTIGEEKVKELELFTDTAEKEMPPIRTFFISGGTELASLFDVSRTLARRAERRVVAVHEEGKVVVGPHTLAYLNRLSSLLYALARLSNHKCGITESAPQYK